MKDKSNQIAEDPASENFATLVSAETGSVAMKAISIPSPYAKKWYDIGFIFAVNYLYAKLAESEDTEFTQAKFRAFCRNRFGEELIEDKYFETRPFYDDGPGYPDGQCPGDRPNTCIPCTARRTSLLRRRP